MPEFLASTVGQRTTLADGYRQHASHQSMSVYLKDWEKAHARLGRQIEELRRLRDDRRENGFPPKDRDAKPAPEETVVDLMAALEESIAAAKERRREGEPEP